MLRAALSRYGIPFGIAQRQTLTALAVILSYLMLTAFAGQVAFAAQNSQLHKKTNCATLSKSKKRRAPCATKLNSIQKPKSTAQVHATVLPPSAAPGADQANVLATTSQSVQLLKITSPNCKLPSQNTRGDVEIGFPRISNRVPSVGSIRAAMIFVDFSDAPATTSPKKVFSYFDSAPTLLNELSYGRANLNISSDFQWHRMGKTSTSYAQDLKSNFSGLHSFMSEAIATASATQDFSNVNLVYVVSNPDAKNLTGSMAFVARPGSEVLLGNRTLSNGAFLGSNVPDAYAKTLVHETSHTFGLVDDWNVNYNTANLNDAFRFTGDFSIMGTLFGAAPEFLAWESWLMGWIDDSQVYCLAPGNQTFTLQTLEGATGVKMAMIPISATRAAVVEYRRPVLADSSLRTSGLLVYTVDTSVPSAAGPLRVIGGTTALRLTDALLTPGEQLTVGKITVKAISSTRDYATINVNVG